MELNIKFDEKMIVEAANRVLDEFEYNGKTIREWADLISNPKTNADRIRSMSNCELAEFFDDIENKAYEPKKLTNADRIHSMSDSELANFFDDVETQNYFGEYRGVLGWLDWLRQEVYDEK